MLPVNLAKGVYWGKAVAKRSEATFLLTLCRYEADTQFPVHCHELPGMFFLVRGDHRETDNISTITQPAASGVWHERGFRHATQVGPQGMLGLNVSVSPEFLEGIPVRSDRRLFDGPVCSLLGLSLLAGVEKGRDAADLEGEVWELVSEAVAPIAPEPGKAATVRERILEDFRSPLGLRQLAEHASFHPVYLARCYRQTYGRSVTDELHRARVGYALARVMQGVPLGEAALEAGLADQSHLNRLCRRLTGTTPGALASLH